MPVLIGRSARRQPVEHGRPGEPPLLPDPAARQLARLGQPAHGVLAQLQPLAARGVRVEVTEGPDAGKGVLISYSYIPGDIEQACMTAGQSAGNISEILPAGEIIRRMTSEAKAALDRLAAKREAA